MDCFDGVASNPDRRTLLGLLGFPAVAALSGCARVGDASRLVIAFNASPPTLDYATAGGASNLVKPLFDNVVEALLGRDVNGQLIPQLADYTLSPDMKTAHFTLRPNVRFHDGSPLTTADVLFSHKRLQRLSALYKSRTRGVTGAQIVDDRHIDFHFKDNALSFVRSVSLYVYSKAYHERLGDAQASRALIGTGPYRISASRQFEYVDLDAFPSYWGAQPTVRRARAMFVPEDMTRIAMLRSGEADLVMAVPFSMVQMLKREGFRATEADMHPTFSLRFQLANPNTPWHDRRVRLAMAYAIDADSIVRSVFAGIPRRYGGFAPGEAGFDPTLKPYPFDPDRARALLAEAGYSNGFRMPLVYWTNAYYGLRETTEAVVLFLRRVGIQCDVSGIDSAQGLQMNRDAAKSKTARLVTVAPSLLASYVEPAEAMRTGYSSASPYSWYHNKAFDALVKKAGTSQGAVYDAALRACARQLHDDLPIIPIWNNVAMYMMRPAVRFTPTARDLPGMQIRNVKMA